MKGRIVHSGFRTARAVAAVALGGGAMVVAAAPAHSESSEGSARRVAEQGVGVTDGQNITESYVSPDL